VQITHEDSHLHTRVDWETREKLQAIAERNFRTLSAEIRFALAAHLERELARAVERRAAA
jgi:predicted transcriptional regulator